MGIFWDILGYFGIFRDFFPKSVQDFFRIIYSSVTGAYKKTVYRKMRTGGVINSVYNEPCVNKSVVFITFTVINTHKFF